jgi:hypothetical protein
MQVDTEDNCVFSTVANATIQDMWGLCAGRWIYEGCGLLLKDGRPCALGKYKHRLRKLNSESSMGHDSRSREDHICAAVGDGTYMFCFAVQVGEVVLQVNEDCGTQLLGMSGKVFNESCDADNAKISNICDHVRSLFWRITYVKNDFGEDLPHALSFEQCPSKINAKTEVLERLVKGELNADPDEGFAVTPINECDQRGLSQEEEESANQGDRKGVVASFSRLKGALSDLSGEIVQSLQGFRFSE